jgi:sulfate/thiosulfate transport system ATP-binding protein
MHISSVFVTHDQEEALEVADRVVVMNQGRIEQVGSPDEVYSNPASPFVYQFLGNVNVFHSRVHGAWADIGREPGGEAVTGSATAFVRPHDIEIEHHTVVGGLEAVVQDVHAIGPLVRVELAHASELIEVELTRERATVLALAKGQQVSFKPRQVRVFAAPPGSGLEDGGSGI